jgi:hypothetical protein
MPPMPSHHRPPAISNDAYKTSRLHKLRYYNLISNSGKAAKRSSALKHQCATLHQDNARLESRVKTAFGSAVPTTTPGASSNGIVGSSFTTAPTDRGQLRA